MNYHPLCVAVATVATLTIVNPAYATLDLTVLDTNISAGDVGTIDVEISGDSDLVQSYFLELRITPNGAVNSSLQFVDPQTEDFRTNAQYVFSSDSFNQINSFDPRVVSQNTLQNDTYTDNDSTDSFNDVTLTSATKLLARINIQHIIPSGTLESSVLADTFDISVIGTPGDFIETEVFDAIGNSIAFTSTAGSVSIQPTAVPEPSSWAMLIGMSVVAGWRRWRSRRSRVLVPA